MEQKLIGLRCPRCLSRWIRSNINKGTHVCRHCGYIWDKDTEMEITLK